MFGKKKKVVSVSPEDSQLILGMVILADESSFDLDTFKHDFKRHNKSKLQKATGDNTAAVLTIDGVMIAIAHMPAPIPWGDLEGTAKYAYNWPHVLEEIKDHKSHLIITVMETEQHPIRGYWLFTQVICTLLRTTNALGVYKGAQSLLIHQEDYLEEAIRMNREYLPLNLWIYFGLRTEEKGNSGYTYGLTEFGKSEVEILRSSNSLEDIRALLFNIAHYVLDHNVVFRGGETFGFSAEEKIPITFSPGEIVSGDSFKFGY